MSDKQGKPTIWTGAATTSPVLTRLNKKAPFISPTAAKQRAARLRARIERDIVPFAQAKGRAERRTMKPDIQRLAELAVEAAVTVTLLEMRQAEDHVVQRARTEGILAARKYLDEISKRFVALAADLGVLIQPIEKPAKSPSKGKGKLRDRVKIALTQGWFELEPVGCDTCWNVALFGHPNGELRCATCLSEFIERTQNADETDT